MSPANFDDSPLFVVNNLCAVRQSKKMRQEMLAFLAETSQNTISSLEHGQLPNISLALRLSRALGCKVEDIYFLKKDIDFF